MNLLSLSRMPVSSEDGWPELVRKHPGVDQVFVFVVLPLSLLPPMMLYFAGSRYGDDFIAGFGAKPWGDIAALFFVAEMLTLLAMGWFIKQVAQTNNLAIDYHDAYLLASLAPVPLWLSSLALFVPSMTFVTTIALLALGLSCGMIYHGVQVLCRAREDVTVAAIVQTVIGAGLAAWGLLLAIIFPV